MALQALNPIVIDDGNYQQYTDQAYVDSINQSRGLTPRPRSIGYGQAPYANKFAIPLMSDEEIKDAIARKNEEQSWVDDLIRQRGMQALDQNGTNYCWINGPTNCLRVERAKANLPDTNLSPASVGARIKNFRNEGGWGLEGLQYLAEKGINTTDEWPNNAIDRKYDTPDNRAKAATRIVTEWYELPPRNLRALLTALCHNFGVAVGYNWWSHEVMACRVLSLTRIRIWNSWGQTWSDEGFGDLEGNRAIADDACFAAVQMAF